MADKEAKSTTTKIVTNDQADYYSEITSIMMNGKNAYELKGKSLVDLHKNAFSGTNGEDTVEHIEYFLKIIDPINLPNVYRDKLRVVVFPISLAGDAWRWFDGIKGSITNIFTKGALWDYWKLGSDEIEPTSEETFDLKETNHDDEQEIGAYIVGNTLCYQDLEWRGALNDSELKDEALRYKAIMEGLIDEDDESSNNG
ncbi:hypothetical protein Tco_1088466 [Tanacetum coccineum]